MFWKVFFALVLFSYWNNPDVASRTATTIFDMTLLAIRHIASYILPASACPPCPEVHAPFP
uniref:Putative SH protein n=1 Tax=Oak-Vale virus TaxID=318852 RepID=G1BWF8_9RHAB|nr:putative SH protein [Oak-Vale virus]